MLKLGGAWIANVVWDCTRWTNVPFGMLLFGGLWSHHESSIFTTVLRRLTQLCIWTAKSAKFQKMPCAKPYCLKDLEGLWVNEFQDSFRVWQDTNQTSLWAFVTPLVEALYHKIPSMQRSWWGPAAAVPSSMQNDAVMSTVQFTSGAFLKPFANW